MKKVLFLLLVIFTTAGCKKFLDVQPRDLKLATSVKDYEDMLNGEGFKKLLSATSLEDLSFLEMMSDDVTQQMGSLAVDYRSRYSSYYVWRNNYEVEHLSGGVSLLNGRIWQYLYKIANISNIVIDDIDNVPGAAAERDFIKAEAYFTRALSYFFIVNIWGEPYDPATAASAKGVPVKLTPFPELATFPRKTLQATYEQILNDLGEAESLLASSGINKGIFYVSKEALYLMLSRVYLYMQDWDKAAMYAGKVIAAKPLLYNLTNETFTTTNATGILNPRNPEIIYTYYNRPADHVAIYGAAIGRHFSASSDLLTLYSSVDRRRNAYFLNNVGVPATVAPKTMTRIESVKSYNYYFRTSEAYLNRAEANAHLGNLSEAADDYNQLRRNRIVGVSDESFTDKESALSLIYKERRLELAFQLHRWFDLRRTTRPRITHLWRQNTSAGTPTLTFVLEENDPGYTIDVPETEISLNPAISPLNLPVRLPQ